MNINRIGNTQLTGVGSGKSPAAEESFRSFIDDQISKLNETQVKADQMTEAFIKGEVDDLHAVMIATEEARLSLDLALQVRNKVVEAYKEINNMQL